MFLRIGRQSHLAGRRGLKLSAWDHHKTRMEFRATVYGGAHARGWGRLHSERSFVGNWAEITATECGIAENYSFEFLASKF